MAYITQVGYTGDVKIITAATASYVSFILAGGSGGGGGNDARVGSAATSSDIIRGKVFLNAGESLYCAVGAGGKKGISGGNAAGGIGGLGINGFSGGTGGNSGPGGWSGSGGGGGAATVLWKLNGGVIDYVALAAGGGGGGGGGNYGVGYVQSPYDPYGSAPKTDLYYPQAGTNSAWHYILNTFGVWNGNGDYTYQFYFPTSSIYTFNLAVDNYGVMYVDNVEVVRTEQNSAVSNYNQVSANTAYITAGWKTIKISGVNTGGPGGIAATITSSSGTIWTTRNSYNQYDLLTTGGRGGKGQNHLGDGGGPGGGGGGFIGGQGGTVPVGDVGAMSGSNGYSFLAGGCDLTDTEYEAYVDNYTDIKNAYSAQTYLTKAEFGRKHYRQYGFREGRTLSETFTADISGASLLGATTGQPTTDGRDGGAIFYSLQSDITIFDGDVWKPVKEIKYYNNGAWVDVYEVYNRASNDWKRVYGNNIPTLTTTAGTFNNTTGSMVPYPPPAEPVYYNW